MKLPAFVDVFGKTQADIDAALLPIIEEQLRSQAAVEIAQLKADIHSAEAAIVGMVARKDVNFGNILNEMDKIALKQRRLANYEVAVSQLFPARKAKAVKAAATKVTKKTAKKSK